MTSHPTTLDILAFAIADDAARTDIELYCAVEYDADLRPWYDISRVLYDGNDPDTVADIQRSADYLRRRGLLEPVSAIEPHIVGFVGYTAAASANANTFGPTDAIAAAREINAGVAALVAAEG